MAIPMSAVKASRGYELLGKTAASFAARDNLATQNDDQVLLVLRSIEALLNNTFGQNDQGTVVLENQLNIDGKKLTNATTKKYVLPQIVDALRKGKMNLSGL